MKKAIVWFVVYQTFPVGIGFPQDNRARVSAMNRALRSADFHSDSHPHTKPGDWAAEPFWAWVEPERLVYEDDIIGYEPCEGKSGDRAWDAVGVAA